MKFKSTQTILRTLLFIVGMLGLIMMFIKPKTPTGLVTAAEILLFIVSMTDFVKTLKLRKLGYPLIIIFYFVGLPIIDKFVHNKIPVIGFTVLGLILTIVFVYNDLIITDKEKNSLA